MNKFKLYFIAVASVITLFSCNKDDDEVAVEVLRDFGSQYTLDHDAIVRFLKTHTIDSVVDHPGFADDQDVKIREIVGGNTTDISIFHNTLLDSTSVTSNGVDYIVYFVKFREGTGNSPKIVDEVLTSYDGSYLYNETESDTLTDGTVVRNVLKTKKARFEYRQNADLYIPLDETIRGWREIFPKFKTGTVLDNPGQPIAYNDFGAGIMFLPSGLGYYNTATVAIPSYSPIMFTFKLYDLKHADQDGDGVTSNFEDINGDGLFTNDDTDGDGIQDYLDYDDDGDGFATAAEVKIPGTGIGTGFPTAYYPYNGAAEDDPLTPQINETYGIPRKFTGPPMIDPTSGLLLPTPLPEDYTDPTRLRRHLDKTATPPYYYNNL